MHSNDLIKDHGILLPRAPPLAESHLTQGLQHHPCPRRTGLASSPRLHHGKRCEQPSRTTQQTPHPFHSFALLAFEHLLFASASAYPWSCSLLRRRGGPKNCHHLSLGITAAVLQKTVGGFPDREAGRGAERCKRTTCSLALLVHRVGTRRERCNWQERRRSGAGNGRRAVHSVAVPGRSCSFAMEANLLRKGKKGGREHTKVRLGDSFVIPLRSDSWPRQMYLRARNFGVGAKKKIANSFSLHCSPFRLVPSR